MQKQLELFLFKIGRKHVFVFIYGGVIRVKTLKK